MSYLLPLNLENDISLVPAGCREAVGQPPIILLSNLHQEKEERISNVGFSC
jgi:uncharacterized protein YcgL (UPF0745 family)